MPGTVTCLSPLLYPRRNSSLPSGNAGITCVCLGWGATAIVIATIVLISSFQFHHSSAHGLGSSGEGGTTLKEFVEKARLAPGRHRCLLQEDMEGQASLGRALPGHGLGGLKVQDVLGKQVAPGAAKQEGGEDGGERAVRPARGPWAPAKGLCWASGRGASDGTSGNSEGKGKGCECLEIGVGGHKGTVRGQADTCTLDPATVLWVRA